MAQSRGRGGDSSLKGRTEAYSILDVLRSSAGELRLGDIRVIIMNEEAYVFLLRVIHENAPHVVKYAFYDMGYRAGTDLMSTQKGRREDPEGAFRYFVETYKQAGYGDIAVASFDLSKPEATLRGTNLFESEAARKAGIYRTPRVADHYSRGIFAGFMSNLLGREVVCEETRCQFRGDDHCEFVILPYGREAAS